MLIKFNKRSKTSVFMHIFYNLHLLVGMDFGCINSTCKKMRRLAKLYCVLFNLFFIASFSYFCLFDLAIGLKLWHSVHLFYFLTTSLDLLVKNQNVTFTNLKKELFKLDSKLCYLNVSYYVEKRELVGFCFIYLYRLVWFGSYCYTYGCIQPLCLSVLYSFVITSLDVVISTFSLLLYSIYQRLEIFASNIKVTRDFVSDNKIYKRIVDLTEDIVGSYNAVFFISLVCNIPVIMFVLYLAILNIKVTHGSHWYTIIKPDAVIFGVIKMLITLAPAILANKIFKQTEKIKIILYDQLLTGRGDEAQSKYIESFIHYIEARPLCFKLYKLIPLDARLFLLVFHFIVTYLIVLLQFTHRF